MLEKMCRSQRCKYIYDLGNGLIGFKKAGMYRWFRLNGEEYTEVGSTLKSKGAQRLRVL